jgi:hypothetical protein
MPAVLGPSRVPGEDSSAGWKGDKSQGPGLVHQDWTSAGNPRHLHEHKRVIRLRPLNVFRWRRRTAGKWLPIIRLRPLNVWRFRRRTGKWLLTHDRAAPASPQRHAYQLQCAP